MDIMTFADIEEFLLGVVEERKKHFGKVLRFSEHSDSKAQKLESDKPVLFHDFVVKKNFEKEHLADAFVTLVRLMIYECKYLGNGVHVMSQVQDFSDAWVKFLTEKHGEKYVEHLTALADREDARKYFGLSILTYEDSEVDLEDAEEIKKHTLELAQETLSALEKN